MIIQTVKKYNRLARYKYSEAVTQWNYKKGGFPCLAMYLFLKDNGEARQRGFVITQGNTHYFRLTRKKLNLLQENLKNVKRI